MLGKKMRVLGLRRVYGADQEDQPILQWPGEEQKESYQGKGVSVVKEMHQGEDWKGPWSWQYGSRDADFEGQRRRQNIAG